MIRLERDGNFKRLLGDDQLKKEMEAENIFVNFEEAEVNFPPSYKVPSRYGNFYFEIFSMPDLFTVQPSNQRLQQGQGAILHRQNPLSVGIDNQKRVCTFLQCFFSRSQVEIFSLHYYSAQSVKTSDHKPVWGVWKVEAVDPEADQLRRMAKMDKYLTMHQMRPKLSKSNYFQRGSSERNEAEKR